MDDLKSFRILAEKAPFGMMLIGGKGRYLYVNPKFTADFGYTLQDIPDGKTFFSIAYPDPVYRKEAIAAWVEDTKTPRSGEQPPRVFTIVTRHGEKRTVNMTNVRLETGGFLVAFENITDKRKAERALEESEATLKSIFRAAPVGIGLVSNRILLQVNDLICEMTGYSRDELVGQSARILYPTDEDFAYVGREKYAQIGTQGTGTVETRWKRKDGRITDILLSSTPLDMADLQKGVTFTALDITERKRAERALAEREQRLDLALRGADLGMWDWNLQNGHVAFNDRWAEMLGYTLDEIDPSIDAWEGLVHPDDIPGVRIVLDRHLRGEAASYETEHRVRHKSGEWVWVLDKGKVTERDKEGKPLRACGTHLDITDRKRIELQLLQSEKMNAIGTLAGGIAHDFNNLLMGVQGYVSLMLFNLDPTHGHYEKLKNIEEQVRSGAALTKQLLGFARGGRYEVKAMDVRPVIDRTSDMFGRTKREITIHRRYQEDIWPIEADKGQIEQVLLNLYVNAWQAMPGGGDLYLDVANVILTDTYVKPYAISPGRYVKVTVTDTGVGMDTRTKNRIFEPFFTTRDMGRGTGLGLASVYGIIKGHKGFINVYSEKGVGTTFSIYLPASERIIERETHVASSVVMGKETILLVDDEKQILDVSRQILLSLGYNVITAGSGEEAIRIYETQRDQIDVVVLDMVMPGMGGGEAFSALKAVNPRVRVILSSGYSLNGHASEIIKKGCSAFIQKPFSIEDISRRLRDVLDRAV